jgi:Ca-activated chloride channel family protein
MLNPRAYLNSRPDGFGVLEIPGENPDAPRRFVPLKRTDLAGTVAGPLATLRLTQTFALDGSPSDPPIEALYRFPLPGDAAVTGVRVRFGDAEIRTELKERAQAQEEYEAARRSGRQAALVTRESPDVFTLAVTGIKPGQEVQVGTDYVQLARAEAAGWSLRVPLTTSPRYVRQDELGSPHAQGQPLALLRDPGHRFALDLTFTGAAQIASPTHALAAAGDRVRLRDGEVVPDRDCVITWRPAAEADRPAVRAWVHPDAAGGRSYFLALCTPPRAKAAAPGVAREVVLLVDHSGSMEGAKWEAADWAVERFLAGLTDRDSFALGLFHNHTKWLAKETRPATRDAVRAAVKFLREHRDSGGTELGVALEQALDLRRAEGAPSRHVLVITDAEVSDAGRILRLADAEAAKPDRRRVSVLCIDAAPNAALATELAERGGGVSRFLTSDPEENDITTALDEVLADWSAPLFTGLTLEVNRVGAEAAGRQVVLLTPGPASGIDLGDLPAGRAVWVVGRVPAGGDALMFRLGASASEVLAECKAEPGGDAVAGLKALFGAQRIRRLEYLMHAGLSADELRAELHQLGHDAAGGGGSKVYAENARAAAGDVVRKLLVAESLAAGLPSSETAFVAVRSEAGRVVSDTVVVANALPAGWSGHFLGGGGGPAGYAGAVVQSCLMSAPLPAAPPVAGGGVRKARSASPPRPGQSMKLAPEMIDRLREASARGAKLNAELTAPAPVVGDTHITVAAGQYPTANGVVLFDSARDAASHPIPAAGRLTSLRLTVADPAVTADAIDPGLTLALFVGDPSAPRARVRLADVLRQGGRRPLNVRRDPGQAVRLVLEDPSGGWPAGVPALEIVLGWE